MASPEKIGELLFRYMRGELTTSEASELERWRTASPENEQSFRELTDPEHIRLDLKKIYSHKDAVWEKIIERVPQLNREGKRKNKIPYRWAAAAVILIVLSAGLYYYFNKSQVITKPALAGTMPKAYSPHVTLLLSNGSVVGLDTINNGKINNGTEKKDSELVYTGGTIPGGGDAYNTLTTPRGGKYKVVLSDGTAVWLNSASSLKYPAYFSGTDRTVELHGEAYFEVTKDKSKPFRVTINRKDQVEVLGTHFNIQAYTDDAFETTTLLEGSVKINNSILKPGEEAKIDSLQKIRIISDANTYAAVAWLHGITVFKGADLKTVLQIVSRVYDMDIINQYNLNAPGYAGNINAGTKPESVLKALETAHIHFKVQGKKIFVLP